MTVIHRGNKLPKTLEKYFGSWDIQTIDGKIEIQKAYLYPDESIDFLGILIDENNTRYRIEGTITNKGHLYYEIK
jgi:hypothetical protein